MERHLAIRAIGRSVEKSFREGDMDAAWLSERWRLELENMTDEEFDERYEITKSRSID